MNIAITAAHAMEFSTFRRFMGRVQKESLGQWQHYIWEQKGNKVILLETGIGPEKASGALKIFLQRYPIDCLINFGSAGMIDQRLELGQVFLADEIVDVTTGRALKTNLQMTEAINDFLTVQNKNHRRGRLLTSPEPILKKIQRKKLLDEFGGGAVDMEAYALAVITHRFGIPFASLKMISDRANALTRLEFWKNLPQIDKKLGKLMYGFLEYLKAA